jgi:glycine oxidase
VSGRVDVAVVGGGIVGASCAWRLRRAGLTVAVYDDPTRPAAASVAAGMLTPVTEAYWGEDDLLALSIESMRRWPGFARDIEEAAESDFGLRLDGVLAVGFDADDARSLDDLHSLQVERGLTSERLRARDCRRREPLLTPSVRAGVFAEGEGAVDPRRLVHALERAWEAAGGVMSIQTRVEMDELDHIDAEQVVIAAGAWSPDPVRPVFGEILRLRQPDPSLVPAHVLRAIVRGRHVYVVPRLPGDGPAQEIVVGATTMERGFDLTVTAGGVRELLDDAFELVPSLAEAHLTHSVAGLRPGTPDNAPIIGRMPGAERVILATGHYRNGVLLAPITTDAVLGLLTDGDVPEVVIRACDPMRFERELV